MKIKSKVSGVVVGLMVLACLAGATSRADASAFALICDDLACAGGNDFVIQDNAAGDTSAILGGINFSVAAFGFTFAGNTTQTKPLVGSAILPQLDLTFSATTADAVSHSIFLYATDTDFTGSGTTLLTLGGTQTAGTGSVTGRAWGGTSNTAAQFSGANLLAAAAAGSASPFGLTTTGLLNPAVNPYSLTIGVAITRAAPGTTTGDLNFTVTPVPEPSSLMFLGTGLCGLAALARRRLGRK